MSFRGGRLVAWVTFILTTLLTLPISAALISDIDRLRAHLLLASIAMIGYLIASFAEAEALARSEIQRRDRLLYQADRLKTLRAMSVAVIHEISQPLSTIALEAQGLAAALSRDEEADNEVRRAVELISRKANDLSSLILTLRQFGSRNDGDYELIEAQDLLHAVIAIAGPEAKTKEIELIGEPLNAFQVSGNRVELQQTILNLVRNAIMASPRKGIVRIVTRKCPDRVEFQVLNRENGHSKSGLGMGIGLIIARAIAEGHGGFVREDNFEGQRSFALALNDAERVMAAEGLVYVIDDDADLAGSVARLLRREGYVAEPLIDPDILMASYKGAPADCIVSDIMMGATNGFDLAMKIRSFDPAVAVIFMTAWASTSDAVDAVRRYGGIDYLEKPLDRDRLLNAVSEGVEWSRERREKSEKVMRLSPREREVFEYIARGYSSKAIAQEMGLSPRTIEDHRAKILAKTESASLADLISLTV